MSDTENVCPKCAARGVWYSEALFYRKLAERDEQWRELLQKLHPEDRTITKAQLDEMCRRAEGSEGR